MSKKNDLPAMMFYWGDWFKAMDVQSLPREIRCTLFEMLGRMWESNDRGMLSINGSPVTDQEAALMLGFGGEILLYQKHRDVLLNKGIVSKNSKGILFSRRMVSDEELRITRSKAGSKGMRIRYNKHSNKTLTNTEDEYEDEISIKKGDARGKKQRLLVTPTISEISAYFVSKGSTAELAKQAFDHYDAGNWTDTDGKPVVNWKQKCLTNWINSSIKRNGNGTTEPELKTIEEIEAERKGIHDF